MAIPHWLWPTEAPDDAPSPGSDPSLSAAEIETATDLFETLSNPVRLEILTALNERSEPISYTALRGETSIEDKGRFNYHLRQLDSLVCSHDGSYALTEDGEELVETVLADREVRGYK
jgi:citrate synthase